MADVPAYLTINVNGPGRNNFAVSQNDVVCLVKRYASDQALSQDWRCVRCRLERCSSGDQLIGASACLAGGVHGFGGACASGFKAIESV